jgi:hypothetical protein
MKTFVAVALIFAMGQAACCVAEANILPARNPTDNFAMGADWQAPRSLPPRFRNTAPTRISPGGLIARIIAVRAISSIFARRLHSAAAASATAIAISADFCAVIRDRRNRGR